MSFETTAELDLAVSDQALRQVRGKIESELGAIEIGTTDGGTMSAQSARSGSGGSRRRRQSMRMERTQTEHLEDIALYLESIDDVLSEGGLLGGDGGLPGSGIFAEVVGAGAETAGDVGVEAGDAVADAVSDVLTGTVASTLGNTISSAINDSTVAVEPNPLPVEGGGSGGTNVTVTPTVRPTIEPDFGPDINLPDLPDLNLGVPDTLSVDRTPLPVNREPLPVEDVGPLPVEDVGPITVAVRGGGRGSPSDSSGGGRNIAERFTDAFGNIPIIGPPAEEFSENVGRRSRELTPFVSPQESGDRSTGGRGNLSVDVTHSPTYNMEVDPRQLNQLADRIVSELESRVERDIDEIRDDLDEVEGDIAGLERELKSGSGVR